MTNTTTTPAVSTTEFGFNKEARAALAQFAEAKDLADKAAALKAEAEAVLRVALNGATVATIGGVKVLELVSRERSGIDTDTLKDAFPELYETLKTTTRYDFIKIAR